MGTRSPKEAQVPLQWLWESLWKILPSQSPLQSAYKLAASPSPAQLWVNLGQAVFLGGVFHVWPKGCKILDELLFNSFKMIEPAEMESSLSIVPSL